MSRTKSTLRIVLAVAMIAVGASHFFAPAGFVKIVPRALPYPLFLVYVSGLFEIAGGAGLLAERTERAAAWGLVLLYVAVFPANINMAVNQIQPEGMTLSPALFWLRLPLQIVLIAWAWWMTRRSPRAPASGRERP